MTGSIYTEDVINKKSETLGAALDSLKEIMSDPETPTEERLKAIKTFNRLMDNMNKADFLNTAIEDNGKGRKQLIDKLDSMK